LLGQCFLSPDKDRLERVGNKLNEVQDLLLGKMECAFMLGVNLSRVPSGHLVGRNFDCLLRSVGTLGDHEIIR
jgi:hypothetical protein